eukprot:scaffold160462_cov30-Prasinocladus_malaysianus.AAC.1
MEIHRDRSLLALQVGASPTKSAKSRTHPLPLLFRVLISWSCLQGPAAKDVLQPLTDTDLSKLYFSMFAYIEVGGVPVWITRTG